MLTSRSKCAMKCVVCVLRVHVQVVEEAVDGREKLCKDFSPSIIRIMSGKTKCCFEICLCV